MIRPTRALHTLLILLTALGTAVAGFGAWVWRDLNAQVVHQESNQPIQIARGESLEQILQTLQSKGILRETFPLRIFLKVTRQAPLIKAGNYYFPSPISPLAVLGKLTQGGEFSRITVIEGWNRWDIADAMVRIPSLKLRDRKQALALLSDTARIKDLDPAAKNLEGYLFPDTYFIVADTTPQELVNQMVNRFRQVWSEQLRTRAFFAGKSAHDVVTMASIIETEAKLRSERPIIGGVILNRIQKKMPLSMDSTVIYASKLAGAWKNDGKVYLSDVNRVSPYNTRKIVGLPPGPVASPGLSSLEAALSPTQSSYLFYVRDPARNDGAHNFYADGKSFDVGVQALRRWEQQHPAKTR